MSAIKVILLGDSGVGKTAVIQQIVEKTFSDRYCASIGTDFTCKDVVYNGSKLKLQFWTTAGQERFYQGSNVGFYRETKCCVLVFDVTDYGSFKSLDSWYEDFRRKVDTNQENLPIIVLGNKIDHESRMVSIEEARRWCAEKKFKYIETSAKNRVNIETAEKLILSVTKNLVEKSEPISSELAQKGDSTNIQNTDSKKSLKVLILGDAKVGKTSLVQKYVNDQFSEDYIATVGIDFGKKCINVKGEQVTLQLWHPSGQERYQPITYSYIKGTKCFILVYDVTDAESFKSLKKWMGKCIEIADIKDVQNFPFMVIGNKVDLQDTREITEEEAQHWCDDNNVVYYEISTKQGTNVQEAFQALAEKALI